jgi:glucokinase
MPGLFCCFRGCLTLRVPDPVVLGKVRAKKDQDGATCEDRTMVMPVLISGDAAFAGQGVIAECFGLSGLRGHRRRRAPRQRMPADARCTCSANDAIVRTSRVLSMAAASPERAKRPQRSPMDVSQDHVLLGDIGATNARFALLSNGVVGPIKRLSVADFPSFRDAVDAFLDADRRKLSGQRAVLAVAGPVDDDRCVLTNCPWAIDARELRAAFGLASVHLCNDFEAAASSLPYLEEADLYRLGGGECVRTAPMAVLGPGSGLGVACLVPGVDGSVVIASEGGHATMAATSRREDAILDHLRRQFGHVSAERVVSGPGLESLYRAVVALDGIAAPQRDAAGITKAALAGDCAAARVALELFCAMLGTIAGNVALMFGARGGVFIAGGIVPRITDFLARSEFRARFEGKGRFRAYLEAIPSSVVVHPAATFIGLRTIAHGASELVGGSGRAPS